VELSVSTPEFSQGPALAPREPGRARADRRADVRVTRKFKASPERVFDAWLDPRIARRWLFATASRPITRVTIDARVGGAFRFVDRNDGAHIEHAGVYIEILRPRRLAFTLSLENHRQVMTRVVTEIVPLYGVAGRHHAFQVEGARTPGSAGGAGGPHTVQVEGARTPRSSVGCALIVAHEDVPAEFASNIEARWTGMLYGLGVTLDPQPQRADLSVLRLNGRSR
jgi:uncharacterized protein YndB with AHSA1/START domain